MIPNQLRGMGLLQATPTQPLLLCSPIDLLQDMGCEVIGTPLTPIVSRPDTCLVLCHSESLVLSVFTGSIRNTGPTITLFLIDRVTEVQTRCDLPTVTQLTSDRANSQADP